MKKLFFRKNIFVPALAVLLPCIFACNAASSAFTVENASSVSVTVVAQNTSTEYTLSSKEKLSIEDPLTLSLKDNPRVEFSYPQAQYYYISDLTSYSYTVYNATSYSVILSEENGMLGDTYGDTLTLEAASGSSPSETTVTVYTSSPTFSASVSDSGAVLKVSTATSTDSDGNKIYTATVD